MAGNWNGKGGRPQAESHHKNRKFENPYNFVPALPRDTGHPTLGDAAPAGHHRYHADRWSGRLSLTLTTVTPLLIPDQAREERSGHKIFGMRTDADGAPYLPPTSIKGALRAAYEAVTNSRMGVLEPHGERLALRMAANESIQLVPCRIVQLKDKEGQLSLGAKLLPGLAAIGSNGRPAGQGPECLMYAAWLRRYRKNSTGAVDKHEKGEASRYPDGTLPQHGEKVFVQTERKVHRSDRFSFLQVVRIEKAPQGAAPPSGWSEGWVYVSGPNIKNKHEERVFLNSKAAKTFASIPQHVMVGWKTLVRDYQRVHEKELAQRKERKQMPGDYLGDDPGQTGFSRHVFARDAEQLRPGTLCYARIKLDNALEPKALLALYPVSISRDLYAVHPSGIVADSLKPAPAFERLSPADRVFGWVKADDHGQHKGQLRIGATTCVQGREAIESVEGNQGVPLAILGAPKPAQARFYAGGNDKGEPYRQGEDKSQMYREGQGLRGRKVYVHQRQAQLPGYWSAQGSPTAVLPEKLNGGTTVYREWRHPGSGSEARSDQNRSITAWVKPGSTFRFDIDVVNLSDVELGALLWLMTLDDTHHFRIGGGKPLGFGSSRLELTGIDLRDGGALKADYAGFGEPSGEGRRIAAVEDDAVTALIARYQLALLDAMGESGKRFDDLRIIRAYRNAATGGKFPVHYPRVAEAPNPAGENYEWFVANEKNDKKRKEGYSLPDLAGEQRGLWLLDPP